MTDFALSPWHMWGTSAVVNSTQRGAVSQQLSKIAYGRPESWGFFLGARIVGLTNDTALNNVSIAVQWNLIVGVGRSFFQTPFLAGPGALSVPATSQPFAFMSWRNIPPSTPVDQIPYNPKFTTQSRTAPLDDGDATSAFPIQHFVAEEIQCSAVVTQSSNIIVSCQVELTALFAPLSHIRPEWFADDEGQRYRGQEQGGS